MSNPSDEHERSPRLRWWDGQSAWTGRARWVLALPSALFLGIAMFVAADLAADVASGTGAMHVLVEVGALVLCLAGVVASGLELRREMNRSRRLAQDLESTRTDLARSQAEAQALMSGLSSAIDRQLEEWQLSSAEAEVALLILKGLSYKDIAQVRSTSERTIRHQATSIFHKAGLSGRAEMAAFFLEDLLEAPGEPRPPPDRRSGGPRAERRAG